jgi:glycosyltransferase involved in cell wall biosynthesis
VSTREVIGTARRRGSATADGRDTAAPHIAVVVPTLRPAGAERVAVTLAAEFARSVHVTVVTYEPRVSRRTLAGIPPPWKDRLPPGCEHVHLPATSGGVRRLTVLATRFAALADRRGFDAVYSFLTYSNVMVALARPIACRTFVHVAGEHAVAATLRSSGTPLRVLAYALPLVYRLPDGIVAVSDAVRDSLYAAGALPRPQRAVTIHNPVDVAAVRRGALRGVVPDQVDHFCRGAAVVGCFARLEPQKDHRTLLRAIALLPPDHRVLLVGDGPLRGQLQRYADELGIAGRTLFTGSVDNPYPLMRRVGVVALTSVEEGFGLVAVEAAALGVPFVGSHVGGLAEVCALLAQPTFPAGDSPALAHAISRLFARRPPRVPAESLAEFHPSAVAARYLELGRPAPTVREVRG